MLLFFVCCVCCSSCLLLPLSLDGFQSFSQLSLGYLLQTESILQLAVQELRVLLQATNLMLQALKLHLQQTRGTGKSKSETFVILVSGGEAYTCYYDSL